MILLWVAIASITTLTTIGIAYYTFFRQPNKLKKLNDDILEATASKQSLHQQFDKLSADKSNITTELKSLQSNTANTREEWNKLRILISSSNSELQTLQKEKQRFYSDIQAFKTEIGKLKTSVIGLTEDLNQTKTDLTSLGGQKIKLQEGITILQKQFQQLRAYPKNKELQKMSKLEVTKLGNTHACNSLRR